MAEATPVTEESIIDRNSSHQIVSDLQVAEIHLTTNGSSTYGEVNLAGTALGQEELPRVRPSQPAVSFQYYLSLWNKLNFTGQLFMTEKEPCMKMKVFF